LAAFDRAALSVAFPLASSAALPSVVEPFLNVTTPAGVAPAADTVAVKMTPEPCGAGLADDASAADVAALVTVCLTDLAPLATKLVSPPKEAPRLCLPTESDEVVIWAWPAASTGAEPIAAAPSLNVTEPVGVAPVDVTVAVSVTGLP